MLEPSHYTCKYQVLMDTVALLPSTFVTCACMCALNIAELLMLKNNSVQQVSNFYGTHTF